VQVANTRLKVLLVAVGITLFQIAGLYLVEHLLEPV